MQNLQVSVVIPAYNAALSLERAVTSAVEQGRTVLEVIIVDNNSDDATLRVAKLLLERYPELIRVVEEQVQGPSAARNTGLKLARAEWIQFLDADDFLLPEKIDRQCRLISEDVGWIIGTSVPWIEGKAGEPFDIAEAPWEGLVFCSGLGDINGNLFRKDDLVRVEGFDPAMIIGEDYELYFRLLQAGVGRRKDLEVGSCYVQHSGYRGEGRGWEVRQKFRHFFVGIILDYLKAECPEYYREKLPVWKAAEIAGVRMYMSVDYSGGAVLFSQRFTDPVKWDELPAERLPGYWRYYGVFGFLMVERLRVLAANALPGGIKSGLLKLFTGR